ncbi:MAG: type II toxin-antitoxin system RelE/ParE family toxin [Acidobacteria bacterium]|nr:type II toxin-antitoxin system RelE/ParE family toxin [Acidobacteriota bacterium]
MRKVIYYKTSDGECPVDSFLNSLSPKQFEKVVWVLAIIRDLPFISNQYLKKLRGTDGIWEVRIDAGSDTFRLLGFFDKGNIVVLTNGFAKKTGKTPLGEIRLAEQRKNDYEKRKRNG